MVSGHAYAKGLRTVKTCVGTRLVPLRHPGFDRPRRQAREIHVGLVDAGQGEDGGLRLSAQLRRGDRARTSASSASTVGYDIHFAGAAGLDIKGTELLGHVDTEDEAHRDHRRRDHPALSRAGDAISNASTNGSRTRRRWSRSAPRSSTTTTGAPRAATSASSISQQLRADRSLGGTRRGKDAHEFTPLSALEFALHRRPQNERPMKQQNLLDRNRPAQRHSASRRAQRAHAAPGASRVPHRRATRSSRSRTAARTRAARLSDGIVHGATVTCPLHNWVISLSTGTAQGRRRRATRVRRDDTPVPRCMIVPAMAADRARHERRRRTVTVLPISDRRQHSTGDIAMAYLAPSEFVTKMVDAGESKIFMSTRDTMIRAYMAGAILALAAAFAVTINVQTGQPLVGARAVSGRLLHALSVRLRPSDRRVRAGAAGADRQAPGRDARRRAAQLGPGLRRQFRRRLHRRRDDGDRLHLRLHLAARQGRHRSSARSARAAPSATPRTASAAC